MQALTALVAIGILAWLVLRYTLHAPVFARGRFGGGLFGGAKTQMVVLERLSLDPKHAIFLVRVGERVLLLGAGEGQVTPVAELTPDELRGLETADQEPDEPSNASTAS